MAWRYGAWRVTKNLLIGGALIITSAQYIRSAENTTPQPLCNFEKLLSEPPEKLEEQMYALFKVQKPFSVFKKERLQLLETDVRKKLSPQPQLQQSPCVQPRFAFLRSACCKDLLFEWVALGITGVMFMKRIDSQKMTIRLGQEACFLSIAAVAMKRIVDHTARQRSVHEQRQLTQTLMAHTSDTTRSATVPLIFRLDMLSCLALKQVDQTAELQMTLQGIEVRLTGIADSIKNLEKDHDTIQSMSTQLGEIHTFCTSFKKQERLMLHDSPTDIFTSKRFPSLLSSGTGVVRSSVKQSKTPFRGSPM